MCRQPGYKFGNLWIEPLRRVAEVAISGVLTLHILDHARQ